jgi:hypothetical protein
MTAKKARAPTIKTETITATKNRQRHSETQERTTRNLHSFVRKKKIILPWHSALPPDAVGSAWPRLSIQDTENNNYYKPSNKQNRFSFGVLRS